MRKIFSLFAILTVFSLTANAGSTRVLENITTIFAPGGASLSVPTVGGSLVTDTSTTTETNKTLTSPVINTPTGIVKGDVGLGNVDNTSDATKNAASVTLTNKTITAPVLSGTVTGTYTLGGTPSVPASGLTGQVAVSAGGTGLGTLTSGSVIVGAGTSTPTFVAPGTAGNVLTSSGGVWASVAPSPTAPTVNASQASPQSVTAAGGISLTAPTAVNGVFVKSNTGAVTVTATPSITACTSAYQVLYVTGEDATNVITLQDNAGLAGSNLFLNGNWTSGLNKTLTLSCDGASHWVEVARSG